MNEESSVYYRNHRNRNRKNRNQWRPKGQYVVWVEENKDGSLDVYSTDSIFWRDFFR